MDEDAQLLLLLLGFPVILTGMIALFAWASYRKAVTRCPGCGSKIPQEEAAEARGLCRHCAMAAEQQQTPPLQEEYCHACGAALSPSARLELWDGHAYCTKCVRRASPELQSFVGKHCVLEETAPFKAWRVAVKMFFIVEAVAVCFFGGIATIAALVTRDWNDVPGVFAVAALLGLMVGIPFGAGAWIFYSRELPTVQVQHGSLTVRRGNVSLRRYALGDCEWFVGKTTDSGMLWLPRTPAVLIVLPERGSKDQELIVPVGFEEQARDRWTAFLELAGVARRAVWEQPKSWALKAAVIVAGVGILIVAFLGLGILGVTLIPNALLRTGVAGEMAEAIGFPVFLPGFIFVLAYVLTFWPWQLIPRVPSSKPLEEQRRVRRHTFWRMVLGTLTLFFFACLNWKGWGVAAKSAAVAESGVLTVLFAAHMSRKVAHTQLATTSESLRRRETASSGFDWPA